MECSTWTRSQRPTKASLARGRRRSVMKLSTQLTRALVQRRRSYGAARLLMVALAACAALAFAPCLPSALAAVTTTFTQTNLVSDVPGMATRTDPNLVNPWGMALGLNSGLWIADNGSGKATTYDGTGQPIPSGSPLVVTIPAPGGGAGTSPPTGVATNGTSGFVISVGSSTAPSTELFASEDGTIRGRNSSVGPPPAVIAVGNSADGAVYKGLALGFNEAGAFLFATNFHAGTVDVFDSHSQPVSLPVGFKDPHLPDGYAPFGIAAITGPRDVTSA